MATSLLQWTTTSYINTTTGSCLAKSATAQAASYSMAKHIKESKFKWHHPGTNISPHTEQALGTILLCTVAAAPLRPHNVLRSKPAHGTATTSATPAAKLSSPNEGLRGMICPRWAFRDKAQATGQTSKCEKHSSNRRNVWISTPIWTQ